MIHYENKCSQELLWLVFELLSLETIPLTCVRDQTGELLAHMFTREQNVVRN